MLNNKVILIGRMVRDATVGLSNTEEQRAYAHFTLAVDKGRRKSEEESSEEGSSANFINCVAFDKQAVFLEKYGRKTEISELQVLNQIFSNKVIAKLGYTSMLDYYLKVCEN